MNLKLTRRVQAIALFMGLIGTLVWAQPPSRVGQDVVWARDIQGATITLDGVLDEAVWNQAEQIHVKFGERSALPTSGWRPEFQPEVYFDQTDAVVRFLADVPNNVLYLAFECADSSVGGSQDWARWDGILMSVKDRSSPNRPTPAAEYFYTFWYVNIDSLIQPGVEPRFIGRFGNFGDTTRTPEQRAAWDAGFQVIGGVSNDDSTPDEGYVVEMRISLSEIGYDITDADGDVVELNFSIWDGDWVHAGDPARIASSRTSWQSPWGNANAHNVGRIHARSDVTVTSGPVPEVGPDVRVPNGADRPAPTIDGVLDEEMWDFAYTFEIAWDDSAVRAGYPGVGPYRSGQFQPELGGNPRPPVLDPGHATVKMFFRDNYLYFGADVDDQLLQGSAEFDRLDAVRLMLMDRDSVDADNRFIFWQLTATFDPDGNVIPYDNLPVLLNDGAAEFAVSLKGASTVNDNGDIDEGFVVEMKVDLTYLGYPADLGDHLLFGGVMLADGDSFDDPAQDYGTRTWWFRESGGGPATPWMVMDVGLTGIGDIPANNIPAKVELYGNYPNPFNPSTTISYAIPFAGDVRLTVYNLLGQQVARVDLPKKSAGSHQFRFDAENLSSGIYFYRVQVTNPLTGKILRSSSQKMVLLK